MKKSISNILVILFVSLIIFSPIKASAESKFMLGDIENATIGSYVSLGGYSWRLIGDNYIMLNKSVTSMQYSKNNKTDYISSGIRDYLNDEFLKNLGSSKRLIANYYYGAGTEKLEEGILINDKISLPSYRDMQAIKGIMTDDNAYIWTRIQVENSNINDKFWCINTKGGTYIEQYYNNKADVYPVATLAPNVVVKGRGTIDSPYIISEMPDQSESTRVTEVKFEDPSMTMKPGSTYNLTPLFVYGDGTIKQVVNPEKYLYDKSLSNRTTAIKYQVLVTGNKINYYSSDKDIVDVDSMGYVTGKKEGIAIVTAKGEGWITKEVVKVKK